ncbi:hypothetical protein BKA70DRAFT_254278 [Coprinopsis sp. MPI-PUGE-AT-0042]|nr:hypothetical protein BKA70DRAFT_254278 [Coprinopsis sp. MPI-PUGE-AT-0042]
MAPPTLGHPSQTMQEEELEALKAIYADLISKDGTNTDGECTISFSIPVELPTVQDVIIHPAHVPPATLQEGHQVSLSPNLETPIKVSVSVLPSFLLDITLPAEYPLSQAPVLKRLEPTHAWLQDSSALIEQMLAMWQEEEGVLSQWVEYLRSGDFLVNLSMETKTGIRLSHPDPKKLAELLAAFNRNWEAFQFSRVAYLCSICLTSVRGDKCLELSCHHIFCRPCLQGYWSFALGEGELGSISCPHDECFSSETSATEAEVAGVMTEAEVEQWRRLRRIREVQKDPTIVYCPVVACQEPVEAPETRPQGSQWPSFRQCQRCSFAFCVICLGSWHGPHTRCPSLEVPVEKPKVTRPLGFHARLRAKAKAEDPKVIKREERETRQASKSWLRDKTKVCPGCQARIEKSEGCNHMICRCGTQMCYGCGGLYNACTCRYG